MRGQVTTALVTAPNLHHWRSIHERAALVGEIFGGVLRRSQGRAIIRFLMVLATSKAPLTSSMHILRPSCVLLESTLVLVRRSLSARSLDKELIAQKATRLECLLRFDRIKPDLHCGHTRLNLLP